jgi:hypothetical protein
MQPRILPLMALMFRPMAALLLALSVQSAAAQPTNYVFQFAIFYNLNMEIDPGQPMVVYAPVFCNANIWETVSQKRCCATCQIWFF